MKNIKLLICFVFNVLMISCISFNMENPELPRLDYIRIPIPPEIPDPELNSIEDSINTKTNIVKFRRRYNPIMRTSTIGVMSFSASDNSNIGDTAADILSICLLREGYKIVERQNIKKIIEEQEMAASKRQKLDDREIIQKIGKLTHADYIIFGSVTQNYYDLINPLIEYHIPNNEMKEYQKRLSNYQNEVRLFKLEQKKMDSVFFEYVTENLFYQIWLNDKKWKEDSSKKYCSFSKIDWKYPYVEYSTALPMIGVDSKELEYMKKKYIQDLKELELALKDSLNRHDQLIQEDEKKFLLKSYYDYYKIGVENDYIIKVKKICREVVEKLKEIHLVKSKIKACRFKPIPIAEKQIQKPAPVKKYVSYVQNGVSLKIIDIKTGDIVWIAQANKRHVEVQKGFHEMFETVVNEINMPIDE